KDHDVADGLLLLPALADTLDTLGTDALDLAQIGRALVDDGESALAEVDDDLAGEVRTDSLDQARAEILLDAFCRVRRRRAQVGRLELLSVLRVGDPLPRRADTLSGDNLAGHRADDRDKAAPPRHLHAQDGKARLRIVKGDSFDTAGKRLFHDAHSTRALRHGRCQLPRSFPIGSVDRKRTSLEILIDRKLGEVP